MAVGSYYLTTDCTGQELVKPEAGWLAGQLLREKSKFMLGQTRP